jgi:prepilin-type N-terminal cleavage/methylation domain-containing protein
LLLTGFFLRKASRNEAFFSLERVAENVMVKMKKKSIQHIESGFTLIELLVVIAIIGIMSGMVMFALAGAREDSKRAKTKATVEKINALVMQKFEEFRYRTIKLPIPRRFTQRNFGLAAIPGRPEAAPLLKPRTVATIRTILLKDYMRMEMPDKQSDLTYTPTNVIGITLEDSTTVTLDDFGGRYSPRDYNVLRNYFNLDTVEPEPVTGAPFSNMTLLTTSRPTWTDTWESAECLYAIVANSFTGGANALEGFHASEIGDVDGDSYPEFIDAWGLPIRFIRWPAGHDSELNLSYKSTPDAFDPHRTNSAWTNNSLTQKPWTLIPLIVSGGPDRDFGIDDSYNPIYATVQNAYAPDTDTAGVGATVNAAAMSDNVSNHDLLLE